VGVVLVAIRVLVCFLSLCWLACCVCCVCVFCYDLRLLCFACVVFVCVLLRDVKFVFVDMFVVIGCVSDLACIERSCLFVFVCVSCLFVGVDGQFVSVVVQMWL
jgi:hypothetical protein